MEPIAGKIVVEDVEELCHAVDPWELRMNQLSRGRFNGVIGFAQVHGILITHECWSNRIAATGATPAGYLVLAGPVSGRGFSWCGSETGAARLAYSFDSSEAEFVTVDQSKHWTLLVPCGLLDRHLGDELASALLPKHRSLRPDPRFVHRLSCIALNTISTLQTDPGCQGDPTFLLDALRDELLDAVADVLLGATGTRTVATEARRRFLAYRRARLHIERDWRPISVERLAAKVNVSRRTLERGFREAIGISPQRFSRTIRLNGLRRRLIQASPETLTVTAAAESCGFRELGRVAGYYRALYGEAPSDTLRRDRLEASLRLSDVLGLSPEPDSRTQPSVQQPARQEDCDNQAEESNN